MFFEYMFNTPFDSESDSRLARLGSGDAFGSLPTQPGRELRGNVQLLAKRWPHGVFPGKIWENHDITRTSNQFT